MVEGWCRLKDASNVPTKSNWNLLLHEIVTGSKNLDSQSGILAKKAIINL